jgi:hypothetical protein
MQRVLGHAAASTALNRYSHTVEGVQSKALATKDAARSSFRALRLAQGNGMAILSVFVAFSRAKQASEKSVE